MVSVEMAASTGTAEPAAAVVTTGVVATGVVATAVAPVAWAWGTAAGTGTSPGLVSTLAPGEGATGVADVERTWTSVSGGGTSARVAVPTVATGPPDVGTVVVDAPQVARDPVLCAQRIGRGEPPLAILDTSPSLLSTHSGPRLAMAATIFSCTCHMAASVKIPSPTPMMSRSPPGDNEVSQRYY